MPASFASSSLTPDRLVAGDQVGLIARQITLITGQNLVRGTVLGKITASSKYTESLSASVDGSQTPDLILAEDTDATAADVDTVAYEAGVFNVNALTIGAGHTAASIQEGLRAKGIHFQTAASA